MKRRKVTDVWLRVTSADLPLRRHYCTWADKSPDPEAAYDEYVEKHLRSECKRIAEAIRRHVDDVWCETVTEDEEVCEFCGAVWTEGDSRHNGGCCERDEQVMLEETDDD